MKNKIKQYKENKGIFGEVHNIEINNKIYYPAWHIWLLYGCIVIVIVLIINVM